jgi:hypothetical protein
MPLPLLDLDLTANPEGASAYLPDTDFSALAAVSNAAVRTLSTTFVDLTEDKALDVKQFIQAVFYKAHGAQIKQFMPSALCLSDSQQNLLAVSGLRHAKNTPLFLERYFDQPVEQMISHHFGQNVRRDQIFEIGNLAVARPYYTRALMSALSAYLHSTDAEWIVFSALPVVRNAVAKMDHPMFVLADATIEQIAAQDRADWGSYYQHQPQVIALRLHAKVSAPF